MGHPLLLGIAGGVLAAKLLYRFRGGRFGGGCARGGRGIGRWGRWGRNGRGVDAPEVPGVTLADLTGKLELNARQKEETDELFARLRGAFGDRVRPGDRLAALLEVISAEPFDAEAAADALGSADKDTIDAAEHVHNILTPEQRDRLRTMLT
jgi:hypothetical protein